MATPRSIRLDDSLLERLTSFTLRHPGMSASAAMTMLLDEGLRMQEHPGIVFRDGGAGRRPGLAAGPDVWEVVRAVRGFAQSLPGASREQVLDQVSASFDLSVPSITIALTYYGHYESEVNGWIAEHEKAERQASEQFDAIEGLLRA